MKLKCGPYVITIGVMLSVTTLAAMFVGNASARKSRAAGTNSEQTKPTPQTPPKLSPDEWRELKARGVLAGHLLNVNLPQIEVVYDPVLKVKPWHQAKGEVLKLHREVAARLNAAKLQPPQARSAHFAWLNEPPYRLLAWGGTIVEIEPIPGGVAVTLNVAPCVQDDGLSATCLDYYIEKYAVVNGEIHFLGGVDPPDASPRLMTD
jgi:hypothetical protein